MKAYVTVTGVIFALLVLVHVWRAFEEGVHLATDPGYVGVTVLAAFLSGWAWRILRLMPRP